MVGALPRGKLPGERGRDVKRLTATSTLAALLALLGLASGGDCYDARCYAECQAEACRDACSDGRARDKPEDCRACLKAYDRVCVEQCRHDRCPDPTSE